jgi:hypothetical protein
MLERRRRVPIRCNGLFKCRARRGWWRGSRTGRKQCSCARSRSPPWISAVGCRRGRASIATTSPNLQGFEGAPVLLSAGRDEENRETKAMRGRDTRRKRIKKSLLLKSVEVRQSHGFTFHPPLRAFTRLAHSPRRPPPHRLQIFCPSRFLPSPPPSAVHPHAPPAPAQADQSPPPAQADQVGGAASSSRGSAPPAPEVVAVVRGRRRPLASSTPLAHRVTSTPNRLLRHPHHVASNPWMPPDCRPRMWTPSAVAPASGVLDMDVASSVHRHIGPPPPDQSQSSICSI